MGVKASTFGQMELLALRSAGWAWSTTEQHEFFDGSRISAGVSAQDRISQGAPMVLVEQIELRLVIAAALRLRGQADAALDQMDTVCDRARGVPIDLRCLAEVQRAEVINSSGLSLRSIEESFNRLLRFREVFSDRVNFSVLCALDAALARSALVLGDGATALEWVAKNDVGTCGCSLAKVWMALTRAQAYVLMNRSADALAEALALAARVEELQEMCADSTFWGALADVAWECGDEDAAWRWATHAIAVAQVRPVGVAPEFLPGDIVWTLGN